ncbi:hypothetical protein RKE38_09575 [Phycicoccus sp. M110.8]|uniref:hypothetical protein n=1 Tax=Phycicoccus sp. M110.8 TaxID=3075433 RepID=UPI0028FD112D|nr:hypothetical protein [Phycicoccus sp. M110.8]MDU0313935.1 hypothetical protein [Phycicoccus sp. M110.8]
MDTSTIIWIIVVVVVVAVAVALFARRSSARRVEAQRAEADSIREEAREHDRELRAREARAEETEAQAAAARAEADRKAAEAKRLEAEAERHGQGAEEVRAVRDDHLRRADERDPDVDTDEASRDDTADGVGGRTEMTDRDAMDADEVDRAPLGRRSEVDGSEPVAPAATGARDGREGEYRRD